MSPVVEIEFDVFLSYPRNQQAWVIAHLAEPLRAAGLNVWFDEWIVRYGDIFQQSMEQGMERSRHCIVCLGTAKPERYHALEMQHAIALRVERPEFKVIPVLLPGGSEDAATKYLKLANWADLRSGPNPQVLADLCRSIQPAPSAKKPQPTAGVRSWCLPQPTAFFSGREHFLADLHTALQQHRRVLISANGGFGKTQTALEYIRLHGGTYADIWWLNAETRATIAARVREILAALGQPVPDDNALPAAFKQLAAAHPQILLVFDNLDDPQSAADFWPTDGDPWILATTRMRKIDTLRAPFPLRLPEWSETEAVAFLQTRTRRAQVNPAEADAARQLARETGLLPLALEQAASYIAHNNTPFADYLAKYLAVRLDLLERGRVEAGVYHDNLSVATTWQVSIERLPLAAREILDGIVHLANRGNPFELIANHPSRLGPVLAEALADPVAPNPLRSLLGKVHAYSLIDIDDEDRTFSIHPLLAEVIRRAQSPEVVSTWTGRWVATFDAFLPKDVDYKESVPYNRAAGAFFAFFDRLDLAHTSTTEAINVAGQCIRHFYKRGRWREAEPVAKRALEAAEQTLGPERPKTLTLLIYLANLYDAQERYKESECLHLRALKTSYRVLGAEHPHTMGSMNNLALWYEKQERYQEAESLYVRAMEIRERVLGPEHPQTLHTVSNLANLYTKRAEPGKAEPLYMRALEGIERMRGPEHPDTLRFLKNMAMWYMTQGRHMEAEPLCLRALDASERVLGAGHPDTLHSLTTQALLFEVQKRYQEAEPLYIRAVASAEHVLGLGHPAAMRYRASLARCRAKMQSPEKE